METKASRGSNIRNSEGQGQGHRLMASKSDDRGGVGGGVNGRRISPSKASEPGQQQQQQEAEAGSHDQADLQSDEDYEIKEYERDYQSVLRLKQQMTKNQSNPLRRANKSLFSSLLSPKKPKEWKLLAFVVFLFLLIIVGLVLVYHFHEDQFYYIYHGQDFVVNEKSLDVKFMNSRGKTVLAGNLWSWQAGSGGHRLPFDCSDVDLGGEGLCLLWQRLARLEIRTSAVNNMSCHQITWMSLSPAFTPSDCFDLEDASWYGGGSSVQPNSWPLEASSFPARPFVSGQIHDPRGHGSVLERLWLSSRGVALVMHHPLPVQVSFNSFNPLLNRTDGQLCIQSSQSGHRRGGTGSGAGGREGGEGGSSSVNFTYSVCVGDDARLVHSTALHQLGLMSTARRNTTTVTAAVPAPPKWLFEAPVWSTWSFFKDDLNQSALESYAAELKENGFGGGGGGGGKGEGLLMIDSGWEQTIGDASFDESKFDDPGQMVKRIRNQGFRVSLLGHPFIGTNSRSFQLAMVNEYFVRDGSGQVPGLVRSWYGPRSSVRWSGDISGVLDPGTNASEWFLQRLTHLKNQHNFDFFHFRGGEVLSLPVNPIFIDPLNDPNDFTRLTAELFSSFRGSLLSVQSAFGAQNLGLVIRLPAGTSTWNETGGLATIIPTVLTMGLIGYPFFIPDAVGGGGYGEEEGNEEEGMPSKELFIRWMQLTAFLPILHFSIPPFHFDAETSMLARHLMEVREKLVLPEIVDCLSDAIDTLSPLIRPIWWDSPTDGEALRSSTEFLVGDSILVAPIVSEGARERDVYLPSGVWMDMIHGNIAHIGPRWLRSYEAQLNEIPYFVRKQTV